MQGSASNPSSGASPPISALRVATLNIWNRSGPWLERAALIRAELAREVPDVIGLQEVLRHVPTGTDPHGAWTVPDAVPNDGSTDQASVLLAGTHRYAAYACAMDYGGGVCFGNAVGSRYPIREHRALELPGRETGEARVLLHALIEHPAGLLPVFVTHLNWKLHHGSVRLRQVQAICEHVRALAPIDPACLPPVIVGDFNASPDADEIRYLTGLATVDGKSVFFADAWAYAGENGPGYTFDRRNRFAGLAHEPPRRIDYVFVRGPDSNLRGEPLATRLAFATPEPHPDGEIWPSDHFGVVTDLSVERKSWG